MLKKSDHSLGEFIDEVFSVSESSSILERVSFFGKSSFGVGEFEGPHGVVNFFKVFTDGEKLVDDVFSADASLFAQSFFNEVVGGDGDSLGVHLEESSFVNKGFNGFSIGVTEGNEGFNFSQHVEGGFVASHESGVMDLS